MRIITPLVILCAILLALTQLKLSSASGIKGCQIGLKVFGAAYSAFACAVSGPFTVVVCPAIAAAVATLGSEEDCRNRGRRSALPENCAEIRGLDRPVCITRKKVYQLGMALNETCNWQKNGDQKCFGAEGFITCVLNEWKITQLCPRGTVCTPYQQQARRVICKPIDEQQSNKKISDRFQTEMY